MTHLLFQEVWITITVFRMVADTVDGEGEVTLGTCDIANKV